MSAPIAASTPSQQKPSPGTRVRALLLQIRASDPGRIRLYASLKGVLSCATAGAAIALAQWTGNAVFPNIDFLAIFLCFVTQIAILAPQPKLRRRTLLLALAGCIGALTLVALMQPHYWVINIAMAPLIFLSFYVRRFGLIWTSVAMVTLFAYYFGMVFSVLQAQLLWAYAASAIAVASTLLWQNVLWPYNPRGDIVRATNEYTTLAAEVIAAIQRQIAGGLPSAGTANAASETANAASETANAAAVAAANFALVTPGRVLVQQSAALTPPNSPTVALTAHLRGALYEVSQGLERMSAAGAEIAPLRGQLPPVLRAALGDALQAIEQAARRLGADGTLERVTSAGEALIAAARQEESDIVDALRPALGHLVVGGKQVAQALRELSQELLTAAVEVAATPARATLAEATVAHSDTQPTAPPFTPTSTPPPTSTTTSTVTKSAPTAAPARPLVKIWGGYAVHPATLLALQGLLAFTLGLGVAWLTRLDHPNWIFWTAYVVIAGSTGESLIKVRRRVLGTVAGALVGTALVIVLPTSVPLTLLLIFFCIFAALYMRVISYAWMVFFITIMVAGLYGIQGTPSLEILFLRPLNILIGGVIAALVVLYVLPFHAADNFKAALTNYLKISEALIAMLVKGETDSEETVSIQRRAAFDALKQVFPSVSYEYNPLTQARSPLLAQDIFLTELDANVRKLENELLGVTWMAPTKEGATTLSRLIRKLQSAGVIVENNIASTILAVAQKPHEPFAALRSSPDQERAVLAMQLNDEKQDDEERTVVRALACLALANQALSDLMRVQ